MKIAVLDTGIISVQAISKSTSFWQEGEILCLLACTLSLEQLSLGPGGLALRLLACLDKGILTPVTSASQVNKQEGKTKKVFFPRLLEA